MSAAEEKSIEARLQKVIELLDGRDQHLGGDEMRYLMKARAAYRGRVLMVVRAEANRKLAEADFLTEDGRHADAMTAIADAEIIEALALIIEAVPVEVSE